MINRPCTPCPSDTSTCMYSPLYFATHVHNVHCITASQANMQVDGLFIYRKTAHIVHKKMYELFVHPAFVTYCPKGILYPLFSDILSKRLKPAQKHASHPVWHFHPVFLVHFGQSTSVSNSFLIPETSDKSQSQTLNFPPEPPPPDSMCVIVVSLEVH
jgi:hypothetical protein